VRDGVQCSAGGVRGAGVGELEERGAGDELAAADAGEQGGVPADWV